VQEPARIRLAAMTLGLVLAMAGLLPAGCDRDRDAEEEKHAYRRFRSEIIELYLDMHPLQASRSGFRRADSLLYAYSSEELDLSISRIKRLKEGLRRLSATHLGEREIEDSRVLLMWLKGELYGLEELEFYSYNPILYFWIVEEALWGIPSRPEPPYAGELSAYEKRISRIPQLLGNASAIIENPPRPYVELAARNMRRLLEALPALRATLEKRYSTQVILSEEVKRSLTGFVGFLEGTLSSQTRGHMILGSENISKIFLYDEGIGLDPAGMIEEAEARIRRITTEQANVRRPTVGTESTSRRIIETGGPALIELALEALRERDEREGRTASGAERPLEVRHVGMRGLFEDIPKSANLTLPPVGDASRPLICTRPPLQLPCPQYLLIGEDRSGIRFLYGLLSALSERESRIMPCLRADTVRALLGSSLYPDAIRYLETEDLIDAFPEEKRLLDEILAGEELRALSRTIVVLKLHSGTITTDSATEYLMRTARISRSEAAADVARASYAPSIAYPGIAILTVDRMVKKAASTRGSISAEESVIRLLMEKYYLPIQLILDSIGGK
jgi:hypothetical protein